jgi:hypothetical protein
MTSDQSKAITGILKANEEHIEVLTQAVIALIEHERSGNEPRGLVESQDDINEILDSLGQLKAARTQARQIFPEL